MKAYRNRDTGEIFSSEELKKLWGQFGHETKFDTFNDFIDSLEEIEGPYYVVSITKNDEFLEGKFNDAGEAIACARSAWRKMTRHDQERCSIEIRRYVEDIEDEDCACFDYHTINF